MKIFVYGTLQRGYGNNRLLTDATFIGSATTEKSYVLFQCGFPKAVPFTKNNTKLLPVKGEVFEVDKATLHCCDQLEGHPNWYVRTPITVLMDNGETEQVEIYEMPEWQDNRDTCTVVNDNYVWSR